MKSTRRYLSEKWKTYRRTVFFLLICAVKKININADVHAKFTVNHGLFCEIIFPNQELDNLLFNNILNNMRALVTDKLPIEKKRISKKDAISIMQNTTSITTVLALKALEADEVEIYSCNDIYSYFYGDLLDNTSKLDKFDLDFTDNGILIRTPSEFSNGEIRPKSHQPKFGMILDETKKWAKILNCNYTYDLKEIIYQDGIGDIIRIAEALQEKRISNIADHISLNHDKIKIVLIAGPSSSGKTSFAERLRIQLRVDGFVPITISIDDYFKNRKETPLNEYGEYDYECLEAIDTDLFNKDLAALLSGKSVNIPHYNFITGEKEWHEKNVLSVKDNQLIIVEGIHGLNELLTYSVPRCNKFKIYISALTYLNIDAHNRIPTTDVRLLRRMIRDNKFRGSTPQKTILQWTGVRNGEEKYIFPFQEEADILFNSALIYEISVLKKYAIPLLKQLSVTDDGYNEAQRLLTLLKHVAVLQNDTDIPNNSLLREFIGGSVFFGK